MEKKVPIRGKRLPEIEIGFFLCWRCERLLFHPPCGSPWANVIIKCTIFLEITHHMIISKYTLESIQLNYFFKIFSKDYTLEYSNNKIEPRYTHCTIDKASEMYYNTFPLSQKLYPPCLNMDFYP